MWFALWIYNGNFKNSFFIFVLFRYLNPTISVCHLTFPTSSRHLLERLFLLSKIKLSYISLDSNMRFFTQRTDTVSITKIISRCTPKRIRESCWNGNRRGKTALCFLYAYIAKLRKETRSSFAFFRERGATSTWRVRLKKIERGLPYSWKDREEVPFTFPPRPGTSLYPMEAKGETSFSHGNPSKAPKLQGSSRWKRALRRWG